MKLSGTPNKSDENKTNIINATTGNKALKMFLIVY